MSYRVVQNCIMQRPSTTCQSDCLRDMQELRAKVTAAQSSQAEMLARAQDICADAEERAAAAERRADKADQRAAKAEADLKVKSLAGWGCACPAVTPCHSSRVYTYLYTRTSASAGLFGIGKTWYTRHCSRSAGLKS